MRTPVLLLIQVALLVFIGVDLASQVAAGGTIRWTSLLAVAVIGALAVLSLVRWRREREQQRR